MESKAKVRKRVSKLSFSKGKGSNLSFDRYGIRQGTTIKRGLRFLRGNSHVSTKEGDRVRSIVPISSLTCY